MRRKIPLLALLFLLPSFLFSQVGKTVIVEAGTKVTDYFTQKEHYRYPGFVQGEVFSKTGSRTNCFGTTARNASVDAFGLSFSDTIKRELNLKK